VGRASFARGEGKSLVCMVSPYVLFIIQGGGIFVEVLREFCSAWGHF